MLSMAMEYCMPVFYIKRIAYLYTCKLQKPDRMLILSVISGILGGQELLIILVIVLVLFGGKKIPELMRGLGKGVGEYNKAKRDVWDQVDDKDTPPDKKNAEPGSTEQEKK
jgi:sec-independent protein translocase protein TatA